MNMRNPLPDQDYLIHCLSYNAETGLLRWRERPAEHFTDGGANNTAQAISRHWNTKCAGKLAFNTLNSKSGYLEGGFDRRTYKAHRIIWKLTHGTDPADVDHINGIKTDNRLCNLRAVSRSENAKNTRLRSNNTSGVMGVSYIAKRGKWQASLGSEGKGVYLGLFDTREEAASVRKAAEREYGFHPNHGRVVA